MAVTPELYTIREVQDLLKVSDETLYRWIRAGKLPAIRFGGRWRVRKAVLDIVLAQGTINREEGENG